MLKIVVYSGHLKYPTFNRGCFMILSLLEREDVILSV